MSLDFNFGEHIHYNSINQYFDLILTFLGAFIGFLFALSLDRRARRKLKEEEIKRQKRKHYDMMNFTNLVIDSVSKTIQDQLDKYKAFTNEIKELPYDQHLPVILASNDLERLKKGINGDFFDAYNTFDPRVNDRIKDYMSLTKHVDYLLRVFGEMEKQVEKHSTYLHNDQKRIMNNIEDIMITIGLRDKNIELGLFTCKSEEITYLRMFMNIYSEIIKEGLSFARLRNGIIKPMLDSLIGSILDQTFVDSIYPKIKNTFNLLENIEMNSNRFSIEFLDCEAEIQGAIDFLNGFKLRIDKLLLVNSEF